jgi:hypothetical protein
MVPYKRLRLSLSQHDLQHTLDANKASVLMIEVCSIEAYLVARESAVHAAQQALMHVQDLVTAETGAAATELRAAVKGVILCAHCYWRSRPVSQCVQQLLSIRIIL